MTEIPNFDALVARKALSGDKVQINDILNKPIIITGFQVSSVLKKDELEEAKNTLVRLLRK